LGAEEIFARFFIAFFYSPKCDLKNKKSNQTTEGEKRKEKRAKQKKAQFL
jgi:hypothetical protein